VARSSRGGGSGIGSAVARALARDGYDVCVTGRRIDALEDVAAEIGGLAVAADTTDPAAVEQAVAAAAARFGGLDAVVCNAGTGASGTVASRLPSTGRWCWPRT
jgi:NADP-dependent 3-hydroxy acid dehydrogenase YdfG